MYNLNNAPPPYPSTQTTGAPHRPPGPPPRPVAQPCVAQSAGNLYPNLSDPTLSCPPTTPSAPPSTEFPQNQQNYWAQVPQNVYASNDMSNNGQISASDPIITMAEENLKKALASFFSIVMQKFAINSKTYIDEKSVLVQKYEQSFGKITNLEHVSNLKREENYFKDNNDYLIEFINDLCRGSTMQAGNQSTNTNSSIAKNEFTPISTNRGDQFVLTDVVKNNKITVQNPFANLRARTTAKDYNEAIESERLKIAKAIFSNKFTAGFIGNANSQNEHKIKKYQTEIISKLLDMKNDYNKPICMSKGIGVDHTVNIAEWFYQGQILLIKFSCELLESSSDKNKNQFIELEFNTCLLEEEDIKKGKGGQSKTIVRVNEGLSLAFTKSRLKLRLKENGIKLLSEPQNYETKISKDYLGHHKKSYLLYLRNIDEMDVLLFNGQGELILEGKNWGMRGHFLKNMKCSGSGSKEVSLSIDNLWSFKSI